MLGKTTTKRHPSKAPKPCSSLCVSVGVRPASQRAPGPALFPRCLFIQPLPPEPASSQTRAEQSNRSLPKALLLDPITRYVRLCACLALLALLARAAHQEPFFLHLIAKDGFVPSAKASFLSQRSDPGPPCGRGGCMLPSTRNKRRWPGPCQAVRLSGCLAVWLSSHSQRLIRIPRLDAGWAALLWRGVPWSRSAHTAMALDVP